MPPLGTVAGSACCNQRPFHCTPIGVQITIATAMAGRGTDILLGGNAKGLTQMALENKLLPVLAQGGYGGGVGWEH